MNEMLCILLVNFAIHNVTYYFTDYESSDLTKCSLFPLFPHQVCYYISQVETSRA